MNVEEIEHEMLALPERDRATLLSKLLETLPAVDTHVADEVVEQRESDLASGKVSAISQTEFVRRVKANRRA
jgi:hypothetical protein